MGKLAKQSSSRRNNSVPDCIWIEIVCRLPAKSVFRFKCVSKNWLSLISEPSFVRHYQSLQQNKNKAWTFLDARISAEPGKEIGFENSIAANSNYNSLNYSTVAFHFPELQPKRNSTVRIAATSNGLLLLVCDQRFDYHDWKDTQYAIFNPTTKQYVLLPPIRVYFSDFRRHFITEGFVTHLDSGIVTSYKVVRVPVDTCETSCVHYFQVFSSEKGKWEEIVVHLPQPIELRSYNKPVVYNGILHFVRQVVANNNLVIAYDPYKSSDRCHVFSLPSPTERGMSLGLFEGYLGCICMDYFPDDPRERRSCKIWTLKDYNKGEWSLAYNFSSGIITNVLPKAFHPLDSDIIYFHYFQRLCGTCYSILSFNIRTQNLEAVKVPHGFGETSTTWDSPLAFVIPSWPTVVPQPSWKLAGHQSQQQGAAKKISGWKLDPREF